MDLLPLLGPPHGDGHPAVGEQVEELVLAGELPEGGVTEEVEAEEANPVQGDGQAEEEDPLLLPVAAAEVP